MYFHKTGTEISFWFPDCAVDLLREFEGYLCQGPSLRRDPPICKKSAPVKIQKLPENGIAGGKCRITGVNPVTWRYRFRQSQIFYRSFGDLALRQHFPVTNVPVRIRTVLGKLSKHFPPGHDLVTVTKKLKSSGTWGRLPVSYRAEGVPGGKCNKTGTTGFVAFSARHPLCPVAYRKLAPVTGTF